MPVSLGCCTRKCSMPHILFIEYLDRGQKHLPTSGGLHKSPERHLRFSNPPPALFGFPGESVS